jgi:hypothetical protein
MINQPFTPILTTSTETGSIQPVQDKGNKSSIYLILAATLALCLAQAGCVGLTGSGSTIPGNPFAPQQQPTPTTTTVALGPGGAFGAVAVGASSSLPITITNSGSATLTISQLSVTGTGFAASGYTLPMTVAPGASASVMTTFTPGTAGAASGSLSVTGDTIPTVSTLALSGSGAQGQLIANPSSLTFTGVTVGTPSSQIVVLTNSGASTVTISQAVPSGAGFSMSGLSLPTQIAAGQSASFTATYTPLSAARVSGAVSVTNNSTAPNLVIPITGTAVQAQSQISVSPTSIPFGNVNVGASASQTVTVTNGGNAALSISNIAASGAGYSVSGFSLPVSIAAGQTSSFSVNYSPSGAGGTTGSVTLTSNATVPVVTISTSGTGIQSGISATPSSVNFNSVVIGSPNSQTIQLSNPGTASLTVSQANVSGAGYSISGLSLPATIAAGGSTTFNVTFAPGSAATISGSISLVNTSSSTPYSISLTGTGVTATHLLGASTSSLLFGSVLLGSSPSQTVTLTNNGNSTVTVGTVSTTGGAFVSSGILGGASIGAGQTATLNVTYIPVLGGSSGNVSITSNATNSPISISLSGAGTQAVSHSVGLTWNASTSTVVGYNVYRSTTSGGPYTLITSSLVSGTTYSDTSVSAGVTYYYVVTAVDSSGNESAYSNEASATVPTP